MRIVGSILKAIISIGMIGGVIIVGVFIYTRIEPTFTSATGQTRSTEPVVFVVKSGESVRDVADHLEKAGIIDSSLTFLISFNLSHKGTVIQEGTYTLTPGMDFDTIIRIISETHAVASSKITVIEGLRLEEIAENLGSAGVVSPTMFLAKTATLDGMAAYADDFIAKSGKPADKSLEGFLFPDTYEIVRSGDDDSDTVIKTMLSTMEERFTPEMLAAISARQINGQPATVYQILTLASIIQREGVVTDELPDIASVYWNRITTGDENGVPFLNADPTSQYANGTPADWWPELDLDMLHIKSPYNTYDNTGLPPGPICSPGLAAIQAAVYPSDTGYLYFVARNDGSGRHAFAKTLAEQEQNRIRYGNR